MDYGAIREDCSLIHLRYIAMDHEVERIAHMESWLSELVLPYQLSRGVRVDTTSSHQYDSLKRCKRFGYDLRPSEIGCFLAHKKCWEECVTLNEPTLVLESDMRPVNASYLIPLLDQLYDKLASFDLVRLHGIFKQNERGSRNIQCLSNGYSLRQCLGDPMGAGAYLITPDAARRLLRDSTTFYQPVDVFLGSTWIHKLRFRTVKPYPFETADFESVIGDRRRPKQSLSERISIEGHRFIDDLKRLLYLPRGFLK